MREVLPLLLLFLDTTATNHNKLLLLGLVGLLVLGSRVSGTARVS